MFQTSTRGFSSINVVPGRGYAAGSGAVWAPAMIWRATARTATVVKRAGWLSRMKPPFARNGTGTEPVHATARRQFSKPRRGLLPRALHASLHQHRLHRPVP